jgi:hypothetical protein
LPNWPLVWKAGTAPPHSSAFDIKNAISTKIYVHIENDQLLEFREKKPKLYFDCLFLIAIGFTLLYVFFSEELNGCPPPKTHLIMVQIRIGGIPIILGVIPMLTIGRISIDKYKERLYFYSGIRKFLFSGIDISFSEISHIEIKKGYVNGFKDVDKIILRLNGQNPLYLDFSWNDE